ncbi:hypothetical protein HHK36_007370 [Tetracentron sinense]|uniref:C3H1-type domain-containing protein n=1 Tax=Tetracentron sinense TaxID=13715 RepID=A0A834ZMD1_TETSI|nr:hypothetical protein HHK36_007370 [Tetracentron sinense]
MYGHGNYAPQFGHGPSAPTPPFQQGPVAPPSPFQQGPPAPAPPVIQQGPLAPPSHVDQPALPHVYHHGPPNLPPLVQLGGTPSPLPPFVQKGPTEVPPPGMLNTGQPYLHMPSSLYGWSPMAPSYPTAQQKMHHLPPPVPHPPGPPPLTGPSHLEMIRAPLPPRVLPPPPSQGQILFRTPLQPPSLSRVQGLPHVRPPSPLPTSSFVPVTLAPFASFVHAPVEDAHPPYMPPPPPPPPPSSPPPLPLSPPSAASPLLCNLSARSSQILSSMTVAANLFHPSDTSLSSPEMTIDSVDKVVAPAQTIDDVSARDDYLNSEGGISCELDSLVEDDLSFKSQEVLDLPPPKPSEEKVHKIEVLCELITKNGPAFEDMARVKESENPEFAYLFGGESGSETAIAHEYFLWMKRKCCLESKLHNQSEQSDSSLRPLEIDFLMQPSSLIDADASDSPADSDMDMEGKFNLRHASSISDLLTVGMLNFFFVGRFLDDVIQSDNDNGVGHLIQGLKRELVSNCNEVLVVKEQLHKPQSSTELRQAKDVLSGSISCSGSSGLAEQEKEHDHSIFEMSFSGGHNLHSAGAADCTLDSSIRKSTSLLIKGGSPFRLIQDYASDDSAEDDDGPCLEDISPVSVSPTVAVGATGSHDDIGIDLDTNLHSRSVSGTKIGIKSFTESVMICPTSMPFTIPDVFPESQRAVESTVIASDTIGKLDELDYSNHENQTSSEQAAFHKAFQQKGALQGDVDIDPQNEKFQKENAKQASTLLKVDEFGRLIREGANDSDSDDSHYTGRRGKRGRSRSRSPQDSRSPSLWRRKEKRRRSRSWSPKNQRSRSKSPAFRRMNEFDGEKMRWERGQIADCLDFLKGRCYRGASCRYLHQDSTTSDAPRRYRSKQLQYLEVPPDSRESVLHGEIKNVLAKISVHEHDEVESHEIQPCLDLSESSTDAPKDRDLDKKREPGLVRDDLQPIISSEVGQLLVSVTDEVDQSVKSEGAAAQVQETQKVQQVQGDPTALLENENIQQPVEALRPLLVDSFPTEPAVDAEPQNLSGETSQGIPFNGVNLAIQPSQANISVLHSLPVLQTDDHHPHQIDSSLLSKSSPILTSRALPSQHPMNESTQPYLDRTSMSQPFPSESFAPQPLAPKELHPPSFPARDFLFQPSHLPPPPPFPQGINAHHALHPPQDFNFPPATTNFESLSAPVDGIPPYQFPLHNHHAPFPAPPTPSWTSLPPPPSYVNGMTPSPANQGPGYQSLQFHQNPMPPRNDFPQPLVRTYPAEQPTHSQGIELQPQTYPSMEEPHPLSLHVEDFRQKRFPIGNSLDQPFGGPSFIREEIFTHSARIEHNQFHPVHQQDYYLHPRHQPQDDVQNFQPLQNQRFTSPFPVQGSTPSSSVAQDTIHPLSVPFPSGTPTKQMQFFPDDNRPPREDFVTSSTVNPSYSQPRQISYGLQCSAPDSLSVHYGAPGKVDSSISRISWSHYNPFASTFDQPHGSSKFSSNASKQEIDSRHSTKYDSPFSSSHAPVDGQGIGGLGSRQMASPSDSSRPWGKILPRSGGSLRTAPSGELNDRGLPREPSAESFPGTMSQLGRQSTAGDQYDPLFDSLELSSNTLRKFDHVQEQGLANNVVDRSLAARVVSSDSDIMLKLGGSHRLLDVEENNKQKAGADAAVTKSPENDEFGETETDAEVGDVENGSPQPVDGKDWSHGIEIDQVQMPGKSKDSRSMKLFKIALADFAKEILKPSWRQGNMSKEAFKTIVKKTVDKVLRAMKSHQIPKSQAKINQYVESSRRKLTKLVMVSAHFSSLHFRFGLKFELEFAGKFSCMT